MKRRFPFIQMTLLLGVCACQSTQVPPAQAIEGTYQALDYDHFNNFGGAIAYPINGQTLTLTIRHVSTDTVSVEIIPSASTASLPTGAYSPTQTLSYPKAYIERTDGASYIYLTGKPAANAPADNQIWLYKGSSNADYIFTPSQTPSFSKDIRFIRK